MDFDRLIAILDKKLQEPLPGREAHLLMAPQPVDQRRFDPKLPEHHRKSGVLLLFYPESKDAFFPLIKRPDYPGVHGGQISLPGGKMEPEDFNVIQTALREAEEEIGVDRDQIHILGQMTDLYIPTSNFLVSPVVGYLNTIPTLTPEEKEVQRIISAQVSQVLDLEIRKRKSLKIRPSLNLDAPYFEIDGEMVWGATAMILSELSWLLSSEKS
ncbi:MAG: CoA pyrophosphatase [Cyclobacteriaceae bacterium]|nr:CoA pyrophosphatase [Cyclobacteriaceae bacterium]MDX5466885.1 CoA pyrophosphatase [Cyclobacteriaceae bacterium]